MVSFAIASCLVFCIHEAIAAATTGGRRLEIISRCSRPMVIAPTGGNSEIPCADGCPSGMVCNPKRNECFFDFHRPGDDWTIVPGETLVMHTPNEAVQQGNGVFAEWSGKIEFYANATMDGGLMPSAFCNNEAFCPTYQGLNGVATAIEFTFVPFGPDYYDVSVINGFNIGIEMRPNTDFTWTTEEAAQSHEGYNCGRAGAYHQPDDRLSSCSWRFDPLADGADLGALLRQVDGTGISCTSDSDCGSDLVCGQVGVRRFNPETKQYQPTQEIRMECGNQIGLWSAYQLCVWSGNKYVSPKPFEGLIDCPAQHNMFACAGHQPWITTCYAEGSHEDGCCGCANWTEILDIPVPKAHGCKGQSTVWQEQALPYYEILKRGCPTAYTFAYDDESSTFTCQSADSRQEASLAACTTYETEDSCVYPRCAWYGNVTGCQVKANDAGYIITLCPEAPEPPKWVAPLLPEPQASLSTFATTAAPDSTTAWSCEAGDVVPCCADGQCSETCSGNQCCPDLTTCPSASEDFDSCPLPRSYTCPPQQTTVTATATATATITTSTTRSNFAFLAADKTSLSPTGNSGKVLTVVAGTIDVELSSSSGNESLLLGPEVRRVLQESLQFVSSRTGIPPENVQVTTDTQTGTFQYQVQIPAGSADIVAKLTQQMANLTNTWTEKLNEAIRSENTGNFTIEAAGTTMSWEVRHIIPRGGGSNSSGPVTPFDATSSACTRAWQLVSCFALLLMLRCD